ncbi:lysozyme inhibitor LprI family protein [Bradyrhizobium icense]|uniref:lysozyme inhibitor LprI family protein n=1 Tax=Bradyrhizobium icense TaxID=1274631 RepID=UPI0018D44CCD|nr:lysozyme inhibitor LprI family protein [Bradyrhizobium icense]
MATASIERAICGDAVLSEWDLRMGQQYQQALRLRKPADRQSLIDSQRSWIQQRNTGCGAVAGNAVWSCVLEATKQRIAALSEAPPLSLDPTPTTSPSPLPKSQARAQNAPPVTSPAAAPKTSDATLAPKPNPPESTSGTNPLLVLIFIVGAIAGAIAVYNNIRRREEEQRRAAERQRLVAKYGAEIADRILARVVWQGMTEEQLLESRGLPADKDYEVRKSVSKETWKYGQTGKNRFSNRIFLENGIVTGWKE